MTDPNQVHATSAMPTIDRIEVFPVALPMRREMHLAGGTNPAANGTTARILVKVTGSNGVSGWGESTPTPAWTYETVESMVAALCGYLGPAVLGLPAWDLDALHHRCDRATNPGLATGNPLARCALDVAVFDLLGRTAGVPVTALLGGRRLDSIPLSWIVSTADPDEAARQASEGLAAGYRGFKVKAGLAGVDGDLAVIRAVRDVVGERYLLVDANQGYRLDEAVVVAAELAAMEVDVFEQPLPAIDFMGLQQLRTRSGIAIAVDESVRGPRPLATALRLGTADMVVAKVQRDGGLFPARRVCGMTEDFGIGLVGSGLTDTQVGFAASLHLFSAFGISSPVDLNGPQFVDADYCSLAADVTDGTARVPAAPGLGIEIDDERVADLAAEFRRQHPHVRAWEVGRHEVIRT